MARKNRQHGFPVNGLLLLDKPAGYSSNQALQQAKHLLFARKAGHTGSLDPIATGLLPLCFGETTKISSLLLHADKTYKVGIRLGISTETGDSEGQRTSRAVVDFSHDQLSTVLDRYRGEYDQMPPMYSALKRNGQPLYKLARQGIEVEREPRPVKVYELVMDNWEDDLLELTVSCSRGFYIRTLAEEIGRDLGCGGHVETLRRTRVSDFTLDQALTLEQIEAVVSPREREKLLMPTDQGLSHLPAISVPENLARYLRLGQTIRSIKPVTPGLVRLYSDSYGFLGLGEVSKDQRLSPRRLFVE